MKKVLGFRDAPGSIHPIPLGKKIVNFFKSNFESFWLREINQIKLGDDGQDHNKLRLYKTFKGSFKVEPYIDRVPNRNQRCSLTRMRISAHNLRIETGRYSRPNPTPINERTCKYCPDEALDNEAHFLLSCRTFALKRECFFNKMSCIVPNFKTLSDQDKLLTILSPATPAAVKVSNK